MAGERYSGSTVRKTRFGLSGHSRLLYRAVSLALIVLSTAALFTSCAPAPAPENRRSSAAPIVIRVGPRFSLRNLGVAVISALTIDDSGVAVVGFRTWKGRGEIIRVDPQRGQLPAISTPSGVTALAVDARGDICFALVARAGVACIKNRTFHAVRRMHSARIDELFRARNELFAFDRTDGDVFRIRATAQRVNLPFRAVAAGPSDDSLVVFGESTECYVTEALTPNRCMALDLRITSPSATVAADAGQSWLLTLQDPSFVVVDSNGSVSRRNVVDHPQQLLRGSKHRIWIMGYTSSPLRSITPGGGPVWFSLVAVTRGTAQQVVFPASVPGSARFAVQDHGDGIVVADDTAKTVTFGRIVEENAPSCAP